MKLISYLLILLILNSCNKSAEKPEDLGPIFLDKILVDRDINGSYDLLSADTKKRVPKEIYTKYLQDIFTRPYTDEVLNYEKGMRKYSMVQMKQKSEMMFRLKYHVNNLEPWVVGAYLREKDKFPKITDFLKARLDNRASTLDEHRVNFTVVKEDGKFLIDDRDIIKELDKMKLLGKLSRPQDIH